MTSDYRARRRPHCSGLRVPRGRPPLLFPDPGRTHFFDVVGDVCTGLMLLAGLFVLAAAVGVAW